MGNVKCLQCLALPRRSLKKFVLEIILAFQKPCNRLEPFRMGALLVTVARRPNRLLTRFDNYNWPNKLNQRKEKKVQWMKHRVLRSKVPLRQRALIARINSYLQWARGKVSWPLYLIFTNNLLKMTPTEAFQIQSRQWTWSYRWSFYLNFQSQQRNIVLPNNQVST